MEYPEFLLRRARFVIDEARHGFKKRDQAITMTMRVISNHFTVGRDGSSHRVKLLNKKISRAALALRLKLNDDKAWHKLTINEHPLELKEIWSIVMRSSDSMSPVELCELFAKNPFVTVTRDEDRDLRAVKNAKTPEDRYRIAGIEIVDC